MDRQPTTAPSLLIRLRNTADGLAWDQFVEVYSPLIYRFARRRGLQDADAADLMQDVLSAVARGIQTFEYDPSRGLFRSWLFSIVRHKVASLALRRRRHPEEQTAPSDTDAEAWARERSSSSDQDDSEIWQREYQLRLLHWGLDQIRGDFEESTWRAFWLTAMEHLPAREAGRQLSLTPGAVYVAKSRVLSRLKDCLRQIDGETQAGFDE
jgi:RNA polymerase sigma factor (sigma-70 family)